METNGLLSMTFLAELTGLLVGKNILTREEVIQLWKNTASNLETRSEVEGVQEAVEISRELAHKL